MRKTIMPSGTGMRWLFRNETSLKTSPMFIIVLS